MKFEINKLRVDEIEINIENIIKQCLKRIGIIIVCAIVFSILVPSLKYMKDLNDYNNGSEEVTEVKLSDAEQLGVEIYYNLQAKVEQLKNYGENALVLKLDYEDVYIGRMQFYVDAEEDVQFDIAYAISNYINSAALAEELYKQKNINRTAYVGEVFGAEVSGVSSGVSSGIVNFRVWAATEEECRKYLTFTKEVLEQYSKQLNETIAEHSLNVIEDVVIHGYSSEVESKKNSYLEKLNNAITAFDKHVATLTDVQWQVINEEENTSSENEGVAAEPAFSILYAVVGFVLGGVLALGVIILYVIFGGRLQTEQELLRRFNISYFGSIKSKGDGTKLEMVCARLLAYLEKSDKKDIAVIGTTEDISLDCVAELQEKMKSFGVKCEVIGNVLTDKNAFEALKGKDEVVLIETIGKSVVKEIYDESMVCIDAHVNVVGYISIIE